MANPDKSKQPLFISPAENVAAVRAASAHAPQISAYENARPLIQELTKLKRQHRTFSFCEFVHDEYHTIRLNKSLSTKVLSTEDGFRLDDINSYYAFFVYPHGKISFGVQKMCTYRQDLVIKSFATTDQAVEYFVNELKGWGLLTTPVRTDGAWFNPLRFFQKGILCRCGG